MCRLNSEDNLAQSSFHLYLKKQCKQGFSNALMFSDHLQKANLYEALGCINRGEFDEIKFEL